MKALFRHPEFRVGMTDLASVAPGLAAWGLMTGVAMVKSGMSLTEAVLMGCWFLPAVRSWQPCR